MANISNLNIQSAGEEINLDTYGARKTFPPKGTYTLQAAAAFPAEAFKPNRDNTALTVQIDPTIVGPTGEGRVLKYTRISAKTFKRGNSTASQLADYLKAVGVTGAVPTDAQKQADLVEQTAGRNFQAMLDWRLWAKESDGSIREVKGMEHFPQREDGSYQPFIYSEVDKDDNGEPKKLFANLEIVRFIPANQ